jgi:Family of unknown function (DUF6152)
LTLAADSCIVAIVKFYVVTLLLLAVPLAAHHSFSAQFDANKQVTLEGTVTKINWGNPHVWFFIDGKDVADASSAAASWACETNGPNGLIRQGWKRDALKIGDHVIVSAYLARDGTKTVDARSVTFPNGSKVFTGSANDGGPRPNQ